MRCLGRDSRRRHARLRVACNLLATTLICSEWPHYSRAIAALYSLFLRKRSVVCEHALEHELREDTTCEYVLCDVEYET